VGAAVKGFTCTGIMPLQEDVVPDERYAASILFHCIELSRAVVPLRRIQRSTGHR
jgi:hypothetical protein